MEVNSRREVEKIVIALRKVIGVEIDNYLNKFTNKKIYPVEHTSAHTVHVHNRHVIVQLRLPFAAVYVWP